MKVTVVAATADDRFVTLYLDDGGQKVLSSSDYKTGQILNTVLPNISRNQPVTIELEEFNYHKNFEEKSGGLVRFFRVIKEKVFGVFSKEPAYTAEEVQEHGLEVSNDTVPPTDTVVAIVNGSVIPGLEKIKPLIENAVKNNSTISVQRFLERIAGIIHERGHSVEDLLKFLEKADLPLADDGKIVAYKRLMRKNDHFVDCHTRSVPQKVGSFVYMDPQLVDPDRRNDCSTGLHIARRAYLGGFTGNAMVICKIAPEDVIAVPAYDANKVRVAGYHIVAEVPKEGQNLLLCNRPMTSNEECAKLLGSILAGNHIGILEDVYIGGPQGTNVQVTAPEAPKVTNEDLEDASWASADQADQDGIDEGQPSPERVAKALDDREPDPEPEDLSPKTLRQKADEYEDAEEDPIKAKVVIARQLLAEGKPKTEIAKQLGTSTRTLGRWLDKY